LAVTGTNSINNKEIIVVYKNPAETQPIDIFYIIRDRRRLKIDTNFITREIAIIRQTANYATGNITLTLISSKLMGFYHVNNSTGLIYRLNTAGGLEKWELSNNYAAPTASLILLNLTGVVVNFTKLDVY
jgi:hypothetical protein